MPTRSHTHWVAALKGNPWSTPQRYFLLRRCDCQLLAYLFSDSRDLPDCSISELHLDAFCLHQRLLLLQHVVLRFSQDSVEVMSPAQLAHMPCCQSLSERMEEQHPGNATMLTLLQ